ncbi:MAG TPA: GIY-YIG nuclease family protein [Nitrospiria bacterium]
MKTKKATTHSKPRWVVYMVKCADDSLYTGITTDLSRRLKEHNHGQLPSAKYTRTRRPVTFAYQENVDTRSEAAKRENEIKALSRKEKEKLIHKNKNRPRTSNKLPLSDRRLVNPTRKKPVPTDKV